MIRKFTQSPFFLRSVHPWLLYIPGYTAYLLRYKSYLHTTGWFKSLRRSASVNAQNQPVPWFTYGMIELLKERLPQDIRVFEYGCGLGTLWWAHYAGMLHAVEHEEKWAKEISQKVPKHVSILYRNSGTDYVDSIGENGIKYDVIIIDGRDRVSCAEKAIPHLTRSGVIIFDDTGRQKYQSGVDFLKSSGFKQLPFRGFSPIEFMPCETSVFYRPENILDI